LPKIKNSVDTSDASWKMQFTKLISNVDLFISNHLVVFATYEFGIEPNPMFDS